MYIQIDLGVYSHIGDELLRQAASLLESPCQDDRSTAALVRQRVALVHENILCLTNISHQNINPEVGVLQICRSLAQAEQDLLDNSQRKKKQHQDQ